MLFCINAFRYPYKWKGGHQKHTHNKRLKRDCQRVAFPVPLSRGGFGCCVLVWLLCVASPLGGRYAIRGREQ